MCSATSWASCRGASTMARPSPSGSTRNASSRSKVRVQVKYAPVQRCEHAPLYYAYFTCVHTTNRFIGFSKPDLSRPKRPAIVVIQLKYGLLMGSDCKVGSTSNPWKCRARGPHQSTFTYINSKPARPSKQAPHSNMFQCRRHKSSGGCRQPSNAEKEARQTRHNILNTARQCL